MRRTAVLVPLAALLLAGCSGGDDEPTVLPVITPASSATAGAAPSTGSPGGTGSPGAPGSSGGTGSAGGTGSSGAPGSAGGTGLPAPGETAPAGPAGAYRVLATDWQRARGTFFTAVSENKLRTVAEQRALAAAYLRAQRAFATGLARTGWPAAARPAVRALLAVNERQDATIAMMAAARSSGAFTAALGRYGTLTGPENAAVTAVARALA